MNKQDFIKKTPFLYHLTDQGNVPNIKEQKKLFSTERLVAFSTLANKDEFLTTRRVVHTQLTIADTIVSIRDQRPINKALDKCLTDNWKREDFIAHLNRRVFMWPNIKRLNIHYSRYEFENPVIFRFPTKIILELNEDNIELSKINSGATRPSGTLGGKAAARGKNTFLKIEQCDYAIAKVAEVTFPNECILPLKIEVGYNPNGDWAEFVL